VNLYAEKEAVMAERCRSLPSRSVLGNYFILVLRCFICRNSISAVTLELPPDFHSQ